MKKDIIRTNENYYINIVDMINKKKKEKKQYLPSEMAGGIESIITLDEGTADATATAENISEGMIAYIKGQKIIGILEDGSKIKFGNPPAPSITLDKTTIGPVLGELTGIITFSNEKAPSTAQTKINSDGSLVAKIVGQNATIYAKRGGGVFAPVDSSNLFTFNSNGYKAKTLILDGLDTSKVTNMQGMFFKTQATEINGLTNFDTSKVINMSHMFEEAQVRNLNLSNFDTTYVTNMEFMFYKSAVIEIDLSNADMITTPKDMDSMFHETQAQKIYCRTEADLSEMVRGCPDALDNSFVVGKPENPF